MICAGAAGSRPGSDSCTFAIHGAAQGESPDKPARVFESVPAKWKERKE